MVDRDQLRRDILRFIGREVYPAAERGTFEALALRAFAYQYACNEPYRRYCEGRDASPETVTRLEAVPAVPTAAFKAAALVCGDPGSAEAAFRTSGTSRGAERRGVHYVRDLTLYRAAALPNFRVHLLPEGLPMRMLALTPPPRIAPDSSLSWMVELVRRELGAPSSEYYVDEEGLRAEALLEALEAAAAEGEPVFLLGTVAALAHLLELMGTRSRRLRLASGSRIMETGGFKRRGGAMPRPEFYAGLVDALAISPLYIVGEYGMTEMCSQFYDNTLRDRAHGHAPTLRYKVVPPWVRTIVVDPETLEPVEAGRLGVLRHYDLANLDSVMAIQTDDLGVEGGGGFEILGRATGAEQRGCSIAMDEWLTAQR